MKLLTLHTHGCFRTSLKDCCRKVNFLPSTGYRVLRWFFAESKYRVCNKFEKLNGCRRKCTAYSDERKTVNKRKYWTQNTSLKLCMLLIRNKILNKSVGPNGGVNFVQYYPHYNKPLCSNDSCNWAYERFSMLKIASWKRFFFSLLTVVIFQLIQYLKQKRFKYV